MLETKLRNIKAMLTAGRTDLARAQLDEVLAVRFTPPASWHARFIAERCGGMQRWRRVSLAAYLEDAEAEYGEPLPIPKLLITEEFSDCTIATMQWPTVSGVVTLYFGLRGFSINGLPSRDPAQLATALRELFQREGEGE